MKLILTAPVDKLGLAGLLTGLVLGLIRLRGRPVGTETDGTETDDRGTPAQSH